MLLTTVLMVVLRNGHTGVKRCVALVYPITDVNLLLTVRRAAVWTVFLIP